MSERNGVDVNRLVRPDLPDGYYAATMRCKEKYQTVAKIKTLSDGQRVFEKIGDGYRYDIAVEDEVDRYDLIPISLPNV